MAFYAQAFAKTFAGIFRRILTNQVMAYINRSIIIITIIIM